MNGSKTTIVIVVVALLILAGVAAVFLMGGGGDETSTIVQRGSDTMLELMQDCAEQFNGDYANITVEVTGGGSGTGIAGLINGQVDVAQASREIKESELQNAQDNGVDPLRFRVAVDGIAVIVHENNPLSNMTTEDLRGIYNGTYTNWNQISDGEGEIVAYGRQSTSGTYTFFQEAILQQEDYTAEMNQMAGNAAIVDAVSLDDDGIGYVGLGYAVNAEGITILSLAAEEGGPAYAPTDTEAVNSGDYVLARYLNLYTDGVPTDAVKTWISWILDPDEGQQVVENLGFYPLDQETINQEMAKLE